MALLNPVVGLLLAEDPLAAVQLLSEAAKRAYVARPVADTAEGFNTDAVAATAVVVGTLQEAGAAELLYTGALQVERRLSLAEAATAEEDTTVAVGTEDTVC
jgi:hypothetical protein